MLIFRTLFYKVSCSIFFIFAKQFLIICSLILQYSPVIIKSNKTSISSFMNFLTSGFCDHFWVSGQKGYNFINPEKLLQEAKNYIDNHENNLINKLLHHSHLN